MIQRKKSGPVPNSLRLPESETNRLKKGIGKRENGVRQTTDACRKKVIRARTFIDEDAFRSRYKQPDVKDALARLYERKCCYCERKVETWQVEHFRPTSRYYWLAYSWDNLLFACTRCNQFKSDQFEVDATRAVYSGRDRRKIHRLARDYANSEQPQMLHPEIDDLSNCFSFTRDGGMAGTDTRSGYTVSVCKLDRKDLSDDRFELLEDFRRDIEWIKAQQMPDEREQIRQAMVRFMRHAGESNKSFQAFRRYAGAHYLGEIVKEIPGN